MQCVVGATMHSGRLVVYVCASSIILWQSVGKITGTPEQPTVVFNLRGVYWSWCLHIVSTHHHCATLYFSTSFFFYQSYPQAWSWKAASKCIYWGHFSFLELKHNCLLCQFLSLHDSSSMCDQCALSWTGGMVHNLPPPGSANCDA